MSSLSIANPATWPPSREQADRRAINLPGWMTTVKISAAAKIPGCLDRLACADDDKPNADRWNHFIRLRRTNSHKQFELKDVLMGATTHTIEVDAPLRAVYNQWTQFEEFPHFMDGVEEVRQEGDKRLFWRAKIGGKVKEWHAEITNQVPDQMISWQSVDGSPNSGTVTFDEITADVTNVTATIQYEPEGFLEKTGDALGIPSGKVEGDLKRFRDYMEERGRETGAWRGQIGEGESTALNSAPAAEIGHQPAKTAGESTIEMPLSEEEVKVGKRWIEAGEVKLHKTVTEEAVNVPVELKREDAVIERIPAHELSATDHAPFQEEHIEIPLKREEAVVQKETHVTGGVRVRKTEGADQETIQEMVRCEDVTVDHSGSVSLKGGREVEPGTLEEKL